MKSITYHIRDTGELMIYEDNELVDSVPGMNESVAKLYLNARYPRLDPVKIDNNESSNEEE